jgi:hypothetical protein
MAEVSFGKVLRRTTMAGLLMLAALVLFAAPASAHGIPHDHHQQAIINQALPDTSCQDVSDHDGTSSPAGVTFVMADRGSSDPCGARGHGMPGHAGCCASSHCPPTGSGLTVAAIALTLRAASGVLPASMAPVDGIAARPGEKPPRIA